MHFSEIERAEVSKKRFVHQVVVYTEVEGVLARFGRGFVTDPVETLRDDLNRLVLCGVAVTARTRIYATA